MTVILISPQLRRILSASSSSPCIGIRLRRFIIYIGIVVITLHINISIVSNSAFNPSLTTTASTTTSITSSSSNHIHHPTNMFRTVPSSSTNTRGTPSSRRTSSGSSSGVLLELLPLHSASLITESSSFENDESSTVIRTKSSMDDDNNYNDFAMATSPSKYQKLKTKKTLRSPLLARIGLFRRRLMIDDNIMSTDDNDDENDTSSLQINNENNYKSTSSSPPPQPPSSGTTTTILAATTSSGGKSYLNNKSPWTISSLFRGGATTTTTTTTPTIDTRTTTSSYYSIYGIYMIFQKLFRTIFVQNFCYFANFIGTTKTRCFCLLVFSVFVESYATTLSKQAKDTGNALLFARACLVYLFCMVGFNISLAKIDVSVAYAVWSALGTTLVTAVGFFWFGESLDATKVLYLGMIVSGVVGLNLRSSGQ